MMKRMTREERDMRKTAELSVATAIGLALTVKQARRRGMHPVTIELPAWWWAHRYEAVEMLHAVRRDTPVKFNVVLVKPSKWKLSVWSDCPRHNVSYTKPNTNKTAS